MAPPGAKEMEMRKLDHGYAAVLDGDVQDADLRPTRAAAESDAAWIRQHPARRDRVRFGHGGAVRVVELRRCEWTGEMVQVVDGAAAPRR